MRSRVVTSNTSPAPKGNGNSGEGRLISFIIVEESANLFTPARRGRPQPWAMSLG